MDAADAAEPERPTAQTADLLDALPYRALNLARAPERLQRQLYEITQLTIRLHANSDDITLSIKLPADWLPEISHTAETITSAAAPRHAQGPATNPVAGPCPSSASRTDRTDAVRAPGRIRTCDTRFRSGIASLPGGAWRCRAMLFPLVRNARRAT
ncbi:hypothetical protein E2651_18610 [Streptomyces sp. MZ04]|nr:hypothetical protein E2651_18610 [Streptomyces sp. MZ04]